VELDHVIWFVPGFAAIEAELVGLTVEAGRRHVGQGTANRRVFFERSYLELLWIDEPAVADSSVLGFGPRCAGEAGACPFGVVLRGELPLEARGAFTEYEVPSSGGFRLLLLTSSLLDPGEPFVAVLETSAAQLAARWPSAQQPQAVLAHPNGARQLTLTTFLAPLASGSPRVAAAGSASVRSKIGAGAISLASLAPRDVRGGADGAGALELALTGLSQPARLAAGLVRLVPAGPTHI
jgi:hypothetical protein